MGSTGDNLNTNHLLKNIFESAADGLTNKNPNFELTEVGTVIEVNKGIVKIRGLSGTKADELLYFPSNRYGMAFNLEPEVISAVMLSNSEEICAGMEVKRSGKVVDVPVGDSLLGRIVNPLGNALDNGPPLVDSIRYPVERQAPPIMDRSPVKVPLQTGILAIDALIPIGRGQRELIVSDRQIGKTAIAVDTIINQKDKNVICVYCSIGQQNSSTAKVIADLTKYGAMDYTVVMIASGDDAPGLNFIAPYAATSIAEYFMEQGKDVLIVYDDLGRHARSYRELSLLLRRPPAREAYPGDIFYIHSRLLERATHLIPEKGGGSLTALPIVETEAQNIAAYIPTNLVSITDGQIYLSPGLFEEGILPAIDAGKSVSRVGGKAQLPAYQNVAGDLRLTYSQFVELEIFERFSTRLDNETRQILERGHKIREVLKQQQYQVVPVAEQIVILLCVLNGVFDEESIEKIHLIKKQLGRLLRNELSSINNKIMNKEKLNPEDKEQIMNLIKKQMKMDEIKNNG